MRTIPVQVRMGVLPLNCYHITMQKSVWLIADPHFGHVGVAEKFLKPDGTKLRPWNTVQEMDEALVDNWNRVVRPHDKVYVLGDVFINKRHKDTIARCNGDKVLIKGNHDIFSLDVYTPNFRDIRAYHVLDSMILSHVPIHESQLARFKINVHGHLHANRVMGVDGNPDPRYVCVCVEQIGFTPIALEDIKKSLR